MSSSTLLVRSAPLPHIVSVPSTAAGPFPMLCFLHGHGERAPMPIAEALTLHGPLRLGNSPRIVKMFIIIAPQLPAPGGDVWHRRASDVRQIVQAVQREYQGDPDRTYLTGFSYGGNGVFDIAIAEPELWAALWAVDPPRAPRQKLPCPLWLSLGKPSRDELLEFMRSIKNLQQISRGQAIPDSDFICEDTGEDHVGTATVSYKHDRIYEWLLSKSKICHSSL